MIEMVAAFVVLGLIAAQAPALPPAIPAIDAAPFMGRWTCHGRFVRSGRPLDALVSIQRGDIDGTLVVDHRDISPGTYHSSEIWSFKSPGARAAIVDATGMRWFEGRSDGAALLFTRDAEGRPLEQFAYRPSSGGLTIDWSYRGSDGTMALGDTLSCKR
ncbi:hypothetical protein ABDK56_09930 [Sphingomonas sp. ASV193]|uniref:hypothetical protein n=1 Tax=Sphingomonas sp. ASV193 TaxID=3144405 RepID=UPI0032E87A06